MAVNLLTEAEIEEIWTTYEETRPFETMEVFVLGRALSGTGELFAVETWPAAKLVHATLLGPEYNRVTGMFENPQQADEELFCRYEEKDKFKAGCVVRTSDGRVWLGRMPLIQKFGLPSVSMVLDFVPDDAVPHSLRMSEDDHVKRNIAGVLSGTTATAVLDETVPVGLVVLGFCSRGPVDPSSIEMSDDRVELSYSLPEIGGVPQADFDTVSGEDWFTFIY